jgi:hypothetical protein
MSLPLVMMMDAYGFGIRKLQQLLLASMVIDQLSRRFPLTILAYD